MLKPCLSYVVAVDVLPYRIRAGLLCRNEHETMEVLCKKEYALTANTVDDLNDEIIAAIYSVLRERAAGWRLTGIGVTVSGIIRKDGVITQSPCVEGRHIPLQRKLIDVFKVPAGVYDRGVCGAFGEYSHTRKERIIQDSQNILIVSFEHGVEGSIISGGTPYKGVRYAPQFGHIMVNSSWDAACACGMNGCLNVLADPAAILAEFHRYWTDAPQDISLDGLWKKFDKKTDTDAVEFISELLHYYAVGIQHMVRCYAPDLILMHGGLADYQGFLSDVTSCVYDNARDTLYEPMLTGVTFGYSALGTDAPMYGAAYSIAEHLDTLAAQDAQRFRGSAGLDKEVNASGIV